LPPVEIGGKKGKLQPLGHNPVLNQDFKSDRYP